MTVVFFSPLLFTYLELFPSFVALFPLVLFFFFFFGVYIILVFIVLSCWTPAIVYCPICCLLPDDMYCCCLVYILGGTVAGRLAFLSHRRTRVILTIILAAQREMVPGHSSTQLPTAPYGIEGLNADDNFCCTLYNDQ